MTICHPPQREEKILGTLSYPRNPTPVAYNSRSYILHFILFKFQFANHHSTVFITTLKSKVNSPFFISLKSFVRRKPIPVFDPRPLYCSNLTTAVGGTKDTNFIDSDHPTVARIKWRRYRGWCLSASEELWNTCDPHHKFW